MAASTGSTVTVCIRLRPFSPREKDQKAVVAANGNTVRIEVETDQLYGGSEVEQRQFVFDTCLGPETKQEVLYEKVGEPILQNTLAGFNGTLFAYGQTGSGKSFSIMGPDTNPGVVARLTQQLFQIVENDPREEAAKELRVTMSFLEIYNEELKDLLDPRPRQKKLYVHAHPKLGVYVPHLTEAAAPSAAECARLLDFGAKVRATAQTNMNSTSSRSHSVCTLRLTQVMQSGKIRNSSVHLCDLAGSERVKKSGAKGQRMREGQNINSSLSVLGQVISKLAAGAEKKGVHVPFRQSKLTHLLMDSLSGNSVTTMLACVSPARSEAEESLGTLRFAESVKKVKTRPQITELAPEEPAMMLETFREELEVLQRALQGEETYLPGDPGNEQLKSAIDANKELMQSFDRRAGAGDRWAQAVEATNALRDAQQQILEEMSLPVHGVGELAGVSSCTPYLLNISDDPLLSGRLIYFLRAEPEVSTVGEGVAGGDLPNTIVLQGVGIPARLCEIRFTLDSSTVKVTKVCSEQENGRLLVNGRAISTGASCDLKHGDRLVFGWAFCFRLIISGIPEADTFDNVTQEVLEYSMTSTLGDMGVMRAAGQWQSELLKRSMGTGDAEALMEIVGGLMVQVKEANALCSEAHNLLLGTVAVELDVGLCFSFVSSGRMPAVVVQVWAVGSDEGTPPRLLAAWPPQVFERRLVELRDAHLEVSKKKDKHSKWAMRIVREEWWAGEEPSGGIGANSEGDGDEERPDEATGPSSPRTLRRFVESARWTS